MAPLTFPPARCEAPLLDRLDALRGELVELAYALELRGRIEAADVASGTAARLGELCEEFASAAGRDAPKTDR